MKKVIFLLAIILVLFLPKQTLAQQIPGCGTPCDDNTDCQNATGGCTECRDPSLEQITGFTTCQEPLEYKKKHEQTSDLGGETLKQGLDEKKAAKEAVNTKSVNQEESFKDLTDKVNNIIPYAIGLGGLIAFILMVFGGLQIILSGGNPEKVKAGKEIITSAIAGLQLSPDSCLLFSQSLSLN